ncbi:uncharacterized protein LOC121264092 [Juglans microcarpa x Juglans regia]|uniref:uncharacterized protein LOC121264092 n=1 Tax=Juglans microcarpa x Juglans regia TaxID=2249226 RepID=UPI001B7DE904|nr:uncharacterized protein LOC121264092 [Juglans microcarpa x Juglans regia]
MTSLSPSSFQLLLNNFSNQRPTVVLVDEFVDALKQFSSCTESLGCVQSSFFKSIHGNMIIWYGAWQKRSCENKELLCNTLITMLNSISSMAILIEHSFIDAYAGESRDSSSAIRFHTGDIISMYAGSAAAASASDIDDLSYACLAVFKSRFPKIEGAAAGVCFRCQGKPKVVCLFLWKSIQLCYTWILSSDQRKPILSYLDRLSADIKYDIFRVVYVSSDSVLKFQSFPPTEILENGGESKKGQVMQN